MRNLFAAAACAALILVALPARSQEKKAGNVDKGKETFEQCSVCHNIETDEKKMGPSLKGLFKKEKLASNGKPVSDANVLEVINKGGNGMPGYEEMLTEEERTDLMAYLKTI